MNWMEWLTTTVGGEFVWTLLVSMVPVIELRGGIPFGVAAGLPVWQAYLAAIIGNMIPVPFIVVYIQRIFSFMRQRMPRLNRLVDKMETKAHLNPARGPGPALWWLPSLICRCARRCPPLWRVFWWPALPSAFFPLE